MFGDLERCDCGGRVGVGPEAGGGGRRGFGDQGFSESSGCSNHFREIELTSSPSRFNRRGIFQQETSMILTGNRQEFIAGEPAAEISYGRKGGVFITYMAIFGYIVVALLLAVAVGLLVHFYIPISKDKDAVVVEDVLSWDVGKMHTRDVDDKLRLSSNIVPSYYRLKIKPNYTNFTFEGNVSITLSTKKPNMKHIFLHVRDLEILNKTILTEQIVVIDKPQDGIKPKRTRRSIESDKNQQKTVVNGNITQEETKANTADKLTILSKDNATVLTNNTKENGESILKDSSEESLDMQVIHDLRRIIKNINSTENDEITTKSQTSTPTYNITTVGLISHRNFNSTQILSKAIQRPVEISFIELDSSNERFMVALESQLKPHINYTLEISFRGKIEESLTGFYRSDFTTEKNSTETLFVTQFEPTSARRAFPCFDEPNFKAMFEISIARPKNMTVLSNMPLVTEEPIDGEELIWSHFERSPPMSTYLVGYTISNLVAIDIPQEQNKVPLHVWARKELVGQTQYAIEIAPKILNFFENYFGVPYALPKIDLLAIPDFAVGAMENWGMLTFRETSLLLDPESSSEKAKRGIATIIAHELAHQWFGNLVTMQWWSDIWLNEGFATYMEYISVHQIDPSWMIYDQFTLDRMQIMILDSLEKTRAMSANINDENLISQIFDDIAYVKAASLLRMLNNTLTEKIFHNGLVEYMNKWEYKNANQNKLWEAFTSAANGTSILPDKVTISDFMNSWTLQAGYPVLNVTRNYENGTITVTQNRFYLLNPTKGMTEELWYVPISYTYANTSWDEWDSVPKAWLQKEKFTTILLPENSNSSWVYFNIYGIGHYRVNYDKKNWKMLQYALEDDLEVFPVVTRGQLLDDAFNLARAGQLNYSVALDLTKHMIGQELEMLPWFSVLDNLAYLNFAMQKSTQYKAFQEYISDLIMPTLKVYGFEATSNDSTQDAILRDHLTYWACLIEDQQCVDWVWSQYRMWTNQTEPDKKNPIPHHSRATIYGTVLRLGSQKEFDFLYERYSNSYDPDAQNEILAALTQTRNIWQLNWIFENSLTSMEPQLVPTLWGGLENQIAAQTAFKFVVENWPRMHARFSVVDDQIIQMVLNNAFGHITTEEELREFKRFIQQNKESLVNASQFIQKNVEKAVLAIEWRKNKMQDVETWLVKFHDSQQTTVDDFTL